jgi:hypothetical protein
MVFPVSLIVAFHAIEPDPGTINGELRDTAI